jgi:hypothetical protein
LCQCVRLPLLYCSNRLARSSMRFHPHCLIHPLALKPRLAAGLKSSCCFVWTRAGCRRCTGNGAAMPRLQRKARTRVSSCIAAAGASTLVSGPCHFAMSCLLALTPHKLVRELRVNGSAWRVCWLLARCRHRVSWACEFHQH